ncbi:hypothetical protein OQA88_13063 [Cercophora sp. LCS_1]
MTETRQSTARLTGTSLVAYNPTTGNFSFDAKALERMGYPHLEFRMSANRLEIIFSNPNSTSSQGILTPTSPNSESGGDEHSEPEIQKEVANSKPQTKSKSKSESTQARETIKKNPDCPRCKKAFAEK